MHILGIDIGGSGIKGAVVDTDTGKLVTERTRLPTPQPATPKAIADTLYQLVARIGWNGPVACGFPARVVRGTVLTASNIDKSWINTPAEALFSKVLGRQVFVVNDADAAGMAEVKIGAGRNEQGQVLCITIGTGIGSALFTHGLLYPNTEFGHIKFKDKTGEAYCSEAAKKKAGLKWKKYGKILNEYLEYLDFMVKPDLIILGGGGSKKFDKFKDELTLKVKVVPAQTLNLAGIIGAAMYGRHRLDELKRA